MRWPSTAALCWLFLFHGFAWLVIGLVYINGNAPSAIWEAAARESSIRCAVECAYWYFAAYAMRCDAVHAYNVQHAYHTACNAQHATISPYQRELSSRHAQQACPMARAGATQGCVVGESLLVRLVCA